MATKTVKKASAAKGKAKQAATNELLAQAVQGLAGTVAKRAATSATKWVSNTADRLTDYASDAAKIPAAAVTSEDAELIASLAAQGPVKMKLVLTPQTLPDVASYNVIGDLKGSEHPEQVVIVSGHLDSWDLAQASEFYQSDAMQIDLDKCRGLLN